MGSFAFVRFSLPRTTFYQDDILTFVAGLAPNCRPIHINGCFFLWLSAVLHNNFAKKNKGIFLLSHQYL